MLRSAPFLPLPQPSNNTAEPSRPRSLTTYPLEGEQHSIVVDKRTHRIRFDGETESGVVVVIEPKD